jgi:hypothetical protein
MGAMECSRPGCEEIMCRTYVEFVGYICHECKEEFKDYLLKNSLEFTFEPDLKDELEKFMDTEKDTFSEQEPLNIDDFFEQYNCD